MVTLTHKKLPPADFREVGGDVARQEANKVISGLLIPARIPLRRRHLWLEAAYLVGNPLQFLTHFSWCSHAKWSSSAMFHNTLSVEPFQKPWLVNFVN